MGRKKVVKEPTPTELSDFDFFTEVDYNDHGGVGSLFPAYTNLSLIDGLKSEIANAEITLKSQNISPDRREAVSKDLKKRKERLEIIEAGRPQLDEKRLISVKKDMEDMLKRTMFTESEMKKGTADPHEEARRMVEKFIPVSDEVANVLSGCNVRINPDDKRVSRNELTKGWKVIKKYFGENANVEQLRKG